MRAWTSTNRVGSSPRMRGTPIIFAKKYVGFGIIPAHAGNTSAPRAASPTRWDHPRACGEHGDLRYLLVGMLGSSPRMRGTRGYNRQGDRRGGIIPAHAGNTAGFMSKGTYLRDHPRACGEHLMLGITLAVVRGSSPRMRGTLLQLPDIPSNGGIIPAHAGNTLTAMQKSLTVEDHPRACGEHALDAGKGLKWPGSSPRMRGTPTALHVEVACHGIIPAHAGNTLTAMQKSLTVEDHPRACGEHALDAGKGLKWPGSSPRMRGTPTALHVEVACHGIIPAHAGNTERSGSVEILNGDHPRACGEHLRCFLSTIVGEGSSPRMRGTPRLLYPRHHGHGIIPAHAGNTPWVGTTIDDAEDHPRACGEHPFRSSRIEFLTGSSPRMRGTLLDLQDLAGHSRIIPAHAGNTRSPMRSVSRCRDHPRACGEHNWSDMQTMREPGSSPRMRGTQTMGARTIQQSGIIPAHAGNTVRYVGGDAGPVDHPRACGEHTIIVMAALGGVGSSPRMRGTPTANLTCILTRGIIPAHAGNTRA